MKKYLIAILLCCPLLCVAQSEWEAPIAHKPTPDVSQKKSKSSKEATPEKELKDAKYLCEGVVPEVDGKVVFARTFDMPGKTVAQVYDAIYATLDSLAQTDTQIRSGIALVNKKEHIVAAKYSEWLIFTKKYLIVDRSQFNYTIIATCEDGKLSLAIERISYDYERQRSTGFHATAEELITDANAVNKKHTRLTIGPAKFRRNTIDRVDEIFAYIEEHVKKSIKD